MAATKPPPGRYDGVEIQVRLDGAAGPEERAKDWDDFCRSRFDDTGHALFAWACYRECRRLRQPVPEWVLNELDRAADGLEMLEMRPPRGDAAKAIAAAFGLRSHGRGGNTFVRFARMKAHLGWARWVQHYVDHEGMSVGDAVKAVAKDLEPKAAPTSKTSEKKPSKVPAVRKARGETRNVVVHPKRTIRPAKGTNNK